jgi:uncharacterized protein YjiS (DUF1127 family)
MSAHTADSQVHFELPRLSYIDAKWEEPSLRAPAAASRKRGLADRLSRLVAAFVAWRRDREAFAELSSMSAYQLQDIGLSRTDIGRAFAPALNEDLRQRGRS